jgi:hypothetical protein
VDDAHAFARDGDGRANETVLTPVTVALYPTIWIALTLFVAAQYGQRRGKTARWVVPINIAGLALCVTHIVIAMATVHGWRQATAIEATARSTEAVYGVRWGGGLFVNYLFVAVWAIDAWWSHTRGDRAEVRRVRFALRIFYAIVILNASVVFARWPMRLVGVCLVVALLVAWRGVRRV